MKPVRQCVEAATMRSSTPTTIEIAFGASSSKLKRNGAAMNRIAARYSMIPCTNAGTGPCLNTGGTLPEEDRRGLEEPRVEELRLGERLVERDELDLRPAQRRHPAEVAPVRGLRRGDAEARPEHAIVGQRRAPALHVAEDRHPRLVAGALLDLALERDRDAAEPLVAEGVLRAAELRLDLAVLRHRALRDDDDRERPPVLVAVADAVADLLDVERPLRDEDHVGAAGDAGIAGDPARVPPHHLDDDHAVVRLRRGVQAVDRIGGDLHGGLEAEGEVGAGEIVVDRLRDPDDVDAVVGQAPRDAERVLAADRDQPVEAVLLQRRPDALDPALLLVRVRAR